MVNSNIANLVVDSAAERLPLSVALRAAAAEAAPRRRRLLWALGERLDAGEPLESALSEMGQSVPVYLRELLRGAAQTPDAGNLLARYLDQIRQSSDRRRRLRVDLTTSMSLILATGAVLLFVLCFIVPQFKAVFADFGTRLPTFTFWLIEFSDFVVGNWPLWLLIATIATAAALTTFAGGRWASALRPLLWRLPLIGPALKHSALADFCEFLSLFVEFRTPLPEAILFAFEAAHDEGLRPPCLQLASWLSSGVTPERAAAGVAAFPPSLRHSFRYATDPNSFQAALRAQASIFNSLAESGSLAVPLIIGPVVVVGAALLALLAVFALYAPLISLLNDLS